MPPHHLHLQIKQPYRKSGITLSVFIGNSKSSSTSTQTSNTAQSSHVTAGKDVNINATS